jgi:hypothetical protein
MEKKNPKKQDAYWSGHFIFRNAREKEGEKKNFVK